MHKETLATIMKETKRMNTRERESITKRDGIEFKSINE
jgi:hypothetical protein